MTNDPMTELQTAVAQQHELFVSYIEAGFTREEALAIIKTIVVEAMRQEP